MTRKAVVYSASIKDCTFGKDVTIIEPSNIYGAVLHDEVFVGPFVEIQKDVVIGKGTRVQSHSFVCSFVEIGENCFVGHSVVFINDLFASGSRANGDQELWQSTKVGDNVLIGSNATILPVTICDNAVIGAGSVVTTHIIKPGIYAGNPARLLRLI